MAKLICPPNCRFKNSKNIENTHKIKLRTPIICIHLISCILRLKFFICSNILSSGLFLYAASSCLRSCARVKNLLVYADISRDMAVKSKAGVVSSNCILKSLPVLFLIKQHHFFLYYLLLLISYKVSNPQLYNCSFHSILPDRNHF